MLTQGNTLSHAGFPAGRRKISVVIQSIGQLECCVCLSQAGLFAQLCPHVLHPERVPVLRRTMTNQPFRLSKPARWLTPVTNWSWWWYFAPSRVIDKGEQTGSSVNQPTTCELASRLGRWLKGDKTTIKAGQIRSEHVKDATQTEALVEMSNVWPLHARGLCITHIPTRDFWYYTMWNLNASSGRSAQRSSWKLKDDLASSETEMETCWRRLERVVMLQAVHHRPRVLGQSLNSSGPACGRRSRVCWRKQKQSVWGRLHEAVNWTVAMLLDLLQTVLNKTFTPFYTNLQSSRNLSHVIASVGRFESLRKNFLSDPNGCSMLVDLKTLLWETNSTAGWVFFGFFFWGGGWISGANATKYFPILSKHLEAFNAALKQNSTFHLTLLLRRM